MAKITLIGDSSVQYYSVVGRLWELVSAVANVPLAFRTVALDRPEAVAAFVEEFRQDKASKGCIVAAPWRRRAAELVDRLEGPVELPLVTLLYKDRSGAVVGSDITPVAVQKTLEWAANLYKCSSALVIGSDEGGLPIAYHLQRNLGKTAYLYDPAQAIQGNQLVDESMLTADERRYSAASSAMASVSDEPFGRTGVTRLASLGEVGSRRYDLVINASPLGNVHLGKSLGAFTAPLDMALLRGITHPETIVQDITYLPSTTLLLELAGQLQLKVVHGDLLLVLRTVEMVRYCLGVELNRSQIEMLVEEIHPCIVEQEAALLGRSR